MTKCFIHIGMEKTGSTSIQRLLRDNAGMLRRAGVAYPLGGSDRANHNLFASAYMPADSDRLSRGARSGRAARQPGYLEAHRSAILTEIRQYDHIVISGEHLFRLTAEEIGALKCDLEAAGVREARVMGVLRSPASFYLSFVQQELKGSAAFPSPDTFFVPYASRVAGWQQHFECRFFEFRSLAGSEAGIVGTFIDEMEAALEVSIPDLPRQIEYQNDSLSSEAMQVLQDFRRIWFPHADGVLNRSTTRLVDVLQRKSAGKPVLRPEVAARIDERHSAEVAALEALTGIGFAPTFHAPHEGPLEARNVSDILANFDRSHHERLTAELRPERYVAPLTRVAQLLKGGKPISGPNRHAT